MTKDTRKHITAILAFMVFTLMLGLLFVEIPAGNKDTLYLLSGALIGAFGTAVSYWLGSSDGSSQKTSLLAGQQK